MQTLTRTVSLIGQEKLDILRRSHICVVGLGGVGGMAAEAVARSGIGKITLIDGDTVNESNINRQIVALYSTIGRYKADVMAARIKDMHPGTKVYARCEMIPRENISLPGCDYIIDAIDDIPAKFALISYAHEKGIPIISSMGTGNRYRPDRFRVTDIEKTSGDPVARILRKKLKEAGLTARVVWSDEKPIKTGDRTPASIAFVPPAAGLLLASHAIMQIGDLYETKRENNQK